jgi:twitching motility protein PilU
LSGDAIYQYLDEMVRRGATDLYLTIGAPPTLRITDALHPLSAAALKEEDMEGMLQRVLTPRQYHEFNSKMELNLALDRGGNGRFRINVLRQRQHSAMVIRRIISKIPDFEELRLPKIMESLALEKRGLVLVCGTTSSGKSTTLASMVDFRNRVVGGHIITIEDPIEFYHEHKKGIVTQREIDIDTVSHHVALKNSLRQKPDVIMVGEVRDAGVMELTIAAAETGHLCYATLHASNAAQAIERIVSLFREGRQQQCRVALALNLRAIVVQRLVRTITGDMTLVTEVMLNEALVREHIMNGETGKIREVMAKNTTSGMITFDQSLFECYRGNLISEQTAIAEADLPTNMKINIQQHLMSGKGTGTIPDIDTSKLSL